jgi:DNA-binding transcriptional regulator YiaG
MTTTSSGEVAGMSESPLESSPLRAYLATALTGLVGPERDRVFQVSDIAAKACAKFRISLYEPRNATDPVHHPEIPDQEVFRLDRRHVTHSDLLIYLADFPSTGAGQELVLAYEALIPIIVMASSGTKVSRMVMGIPGSTFQVRYDSLEDLYRQLAAQLEDLLPILMHRRSKLRRHEENRLGKRIRQLRLAKGLTYDDLAQIMGAEFFSAAQIEQWEISSDLESNLGLIYLREIANALKVDVGALLL